MSARHVNHHQPGGAVAEEEKIEITIEVEGAEEASKQVDGVTASLEKQKKTSDMINQTSGDIQRRNRIDAIRAEAAQVNALEQSLKKMAASGGPANDVLQRTGFQFNNLRAAAGATTALVGNLGRSFTQIVPQASGLVGALQSTGGALGQVLGIIGGGAGLATGGLIAAVALVGSVMAASAERAEKLAEAAKKNAEALKEYIATIGNLRKEAAEKISAAKDSGKYESDFHAGRLSSDEYAAERNAAKALYGQRGELQKKRMAARDAGDVENLRTLSALLQKAEEAPARGELARGFESGARVREADLKKIERMKEVADADKEQRDTDKAAYDKRTAANAARAKQTEETLERLRALEKTYRDKQFKEEAESLQRQKQLAASILEEQAQDAHAKNMARLKEEARVRDKANADEVARLDLVAKKSAETAELAKQRDAAYRDAATSIGNMAASSTIKAFSEIAKGHKVAIGAVLEGIGDQMVAEGTRVLFQAAAMAFFPPTAPFAGALAAVGTAEIAAGIGLGAAGANAAGGSNAGSGGGGGSKQPTNYADPYAGTARYGSTSGGPTVININMPTVISPSAADGARVQAATRQAMRVYGTR